jgi:uncharacterized protein (DUF924 family)
MDDLPEQARDLLTFWFEELTPEQWFRKDAAVDAAVRQRFGELYERLARNGGEAWAASPEGALAAVIGLDQLPRNLFRGEPRAFASDGAALALAERAIARGLDQSLAPRQRMMLYMPFQHSEDPAVQARSEALFADVGDPQALAFARRHREVIARFGRFPHRNAILGRVSTPEEREFLSQPGSAF